MSKQTKVGIFVFLGIILMGAIVFVIGEDEQAWSRKRGYETAFADVAGLKPGAPVRLGGVDVGSVTSVDHAKDVNDPRIYVRLDVVRSQSARIRQDTVAQIVGKGLLGDKMIELTVAPMSSPPLPEGALIKSEEPADMFADFRKVADEAKAVAADARRVTGALADPQFTEDLKGTVKSLRAILDGIALQDGPAHRFIFDPEEAKKLDRTLTNLEVATANLNLVLGDTREVTAQVKNGPGLAHALVYDGEMSASAAGALKEVHSDLAAIRQGNGLAHALIYGDNDAQHVMGNLNAMSDDMRAIVANVRAGKGTLGALLVDPSVYEDIRSLVGNVDRNQVLRALVRYSIKADETKASPPKVEPAQK